VVRALFLRRLEFEVDAVPVAFRRVSLARTANWILTESSGVLRPARPWGLPTVLQVEPTGMCNLSCPGCPAGNELGRERGLMDIALYRSLIDELSGTLLVLLMWDWGEPFLHPRACEMIEIASRAGIKVLASTNGTVLAARDLASRIVESGLDTLIVAIDGTEQTTYEKFRRGGDLAKTVEGIRRVREERQRRGRPGPRINLRFIVMRHNEHELPRLEDFAAAAGADVLTVRRFAQWGGVPELAPTSSNHALPSPFAAGSERLALRRNPCRALWNCPTVHWDGTVCSCFMDWAGEHPLGRLTEAPFREIWRGDRYRRLRRAFRRDWAAIPACRECSCGYQDGNVGSHANLFVAQVGADPGRSAQPSGRKRTAE